MENLLQILLPVLVMLVLVGLFACIEFLADDNVIDTATSKFDREKFHRYGFLRRSFVVVVPVLAYFGFTFQALGASVLCGTVFWIIFEALMSRELFKSPFAVGTTAFTDKQIRRLAGHLNETPEETKRALVVIIGFFAILFFIASCLL